MSKKYSDTEPLTMRYPKDVIFKLDELCKLYGLSRRDYLIALIVSSYDELNGNKELKDLLQKIRDLTSKFDDINDSLYQIKEKKEGEKKDLK